MSRFAARRLLRSPAFTLGVTVLLAWGIGSGTALLSLVDAVSFRSLEVQHPEELVRVVQHDPALRTWTVFPQAFLQALQARDEEFSVIAGESETQAVLSEPAPAQEIHVSYVTAQFFSMLGVPALYGRMLAPSDDGDASGTPPAVLSYAFWNTRFHGDPRVLGQSILLGKHPFVIVGVMPRRFHGFSADTTSDVCVPSAAFGIVFKNGGHGEPSWLSIMARLRPGVTSSAAEAATLAIWQQAITQYWTGRLPEDGQSARDNLAEDLRLGVQLESEKRGNSLFREQYGAGWALLGASALVLEILLCANLATIVLSRNAANAKEVAVRFGTWGFTGAGTASAALRECAVGSYGNRYGHSCRLSAHPVAGAGAAARARYRNGSSPYRPRRRARSAALGDRPDARHGIVSGLRLRSRLDRIALAG